jgi:4-hydroxy-tetrahydrodipicolinate reductase
MTTKVAVVGASGKMGRLIADIIDDRDGWEVFAALGSSSALSEILGADLVVDVTQPGVSQAVVDYAVANDINVLVGTSGWSADRIARLSRTLENHPGNGVIIVPNFSIGSVLATSFAAMAARFYDSIEIVEAHHAGKIDSPSGTAVRTAELMAAARGNLGPVAAPHSDQLARGQQVASIPIHSLRLAGVVAQQEVILGGTGETVSIRHDTLDSSAYVSGIGLALTAALTATGVTVGLDQLLDLGAAAITHDPARGGRPTIADAPSGQAATATSAQ